MMRQCIAVLLFLGLTATSAAAQRDNRNPLQKKYWDVIDSRSGWYCVPRDVNKQLHQQPHACFRDPRRCGLYDGFVNTPTAALPGPIASFLKDSIVINTADDESQVGIAKGKTFRFMCAYTTGAGGAINETLIRALGYSNIDDQADELFDVLRKGPRLRKELWPVVVQAIYHSHDRGAFAKHSASVLSQPVTSREQEYGKLRLLDYLARIGSKAAVPFCRTQLGGGRSKTLVNGCIGHLGELGDKSSAQAVTRLLGSHPYTAIRALGQLGGKAATKVLVRYFNQARRPAERLPLALALANLGQKKYLKTIALYLKGYRDAKEQKRYKKRKPSTSQQRRMAQLQSDTALEITWLKPRLFKRAAKSLSRFKKGDTNWQLERYVLTRLALAQRGNKKAFAAVMKSLRADGLPIKLRRRVLRGLLGESDPSRVGQTSRVGRATLPVAKADLALLAYAKREADANLRWLAQHAAVNYRAERALRKP